MLPKSERPAGIAAPPVRVAAAEQGSFLAALKLFGPAEEGLPSFPMEGYTPALLDAIVHRHGARRAPAKFASALSRRLGL